MSHCCRLKIHACFALFLMIGADATAQKKLQIPNGPAAAAKDDSKGVPQEPSKSSAAISAAASDALNQRPAPGADYIPCRFTDAQLKSLSAPEQVLTLSPADAEELVGKVSSTIQQQQQAGLISADAERELFIEITKAKLTGLIPSEALQRFIVATLDARTSVVVKQNASVSSIGTPDTSKPGVSTQPADAQSAIKTGSNTTHLLSITPGTTAKSDVQAATQKTDSVAVTTDPSSKTISKTLIPGVETSQNMAAIVNSARDTIERLSRPTDVGCAMSVLSYNETSKAYGYIIANNYIAVQVVVAIQRCEDRRIS